MAFDAGMETSEFDDASKVNALISTMEDQFDLVMISEQMEASLVLMADVMCWPLEEVTFLKLNARPSNSTSRTRLSPEQKAKLRAANSADVKIYEHFSRRFEQRVRKYGSERMEKSVGELKTLNEQMKERCVEGVVHPEAKNSNETKDYPVFTYEVKDGAPDVCQLAVMPELNFTQLLKETQLERFGYNISELFTTDVALDAQETNVTSLKP